MLSESLRKKIARFLVYVMLFCNVSPAFAMQGVRSDYRVTARQRNVLNKVNGVMMPALFVEAYKLTEQMVSGVATMVYQVVCSQMIMSALVAHMFDAASKMTSFVDIEGLGRVRVDENNAIVLDAATLSDPTKTVSFTTDRGVVLDAIRCDTIAVTAPSITVRGKTFVKSLDISLSEVNGIFAIDAGSTLSTEGAIIDGIIHNYGTLELLGDAALQSNQSLLFNKGTVRGSNFSLANIGSVINQGTISGSSISLQSNFLQNDGTIGGTESALDLMVHKSVINNNEIFGKSAKVVLTSDDRGFSNKGSIDITNAELQISGVFKNEGTSELGTLTGFVSTFFNKGKFKSKYGSLSVNSGENYHILKLASLISNGDFLNTFTDHHSAMKIESILGTGKFFNRSAFKMLGVGILGIREFYNQNAEFIQRYGCSSFGNTVRFVSSLGTLVNEGSLLADRLHFENTDAIITNAPTAIIKTTHEVKGRIKSVDNLGGVFSEHSFISLIFDTFAHRGELQADKGVNFTGKTLRNYSDLSLHSSRINRIFNGESITDEVDDDFFGGVRSTAATKASNIATMPITQRKHAVTDILQKAKAMNVLQEEIDKVETYCDSITPIILPSNIAALKVMINRDYPHLIQEQLPGNAPALRALISGSAEYREKLAQSEAIPFPFAELNKIIATITPATNIAAMPIAQRMEAIADILQKARTMNMLQEEIAKVQHYCDLLPAERPSGQLRTIADRLRSSQLTITPFPMIELNKLISVYNRRSVPKTAANLWMYFGSNIGRLENTGQIQFIKGLHSVDTYVGTAQSELLLPKPDTLPDTGIPDLLTDESAESVAILSSEGTTVAKKKLEGAGKIQAAKHKYHDLTSAMTFNLFGSVEAHTLAIPESVPTFTGDMSVFVKSAGLVNTKEIILSGVKLFIDLLTQDFENTGSIACLELLIRNCGIFRNKSRIETHADIDVEARQVLNVGDPTITPRSTASVPYDEFFYSTAWGVPGGKIYIKNIAWNPPNKGGQWWCTNKVSNPVNIDFHSPGIAFLMSQAGKIKLNGSELIQNEYSSISASHGFSLKSLGAITNRIGNISSNGAEASIIDAASFIHICGDARDIPIGWGTRYCEPYIWFNHSANYFFGTFDTSTKPEIYTGGDLHVTTTQFPTIKGADIFSGGTVRFDFQTGTFNAEQVHNNVPTMAVHDNILINGQDIGLKGARFVAGMGIGITATGKVAIINPSGNQVILPPTGAIDINVSELAKKSYGHMLMAPQSESNKIGIATHMILDPTAGMKKLFFGRMPDPTKRLVFDTRVMSVLPMILAKYEILMGTRVLNMPKFLTSLDENAQKLNGAIIPANQMPNELLMYFTVEDGDEDGEEKAYLHFNIPVEELGKTLSKTFEIRSEHDLLSIRGSEIDLENTSLSGASVEIVAKKDSTFSGKVSMVASEITATEDKVHVHGDNGVDTKGRFDKTIHYYSIDGGYAGFETATHAPMLISAPKEVILSGGVSEIRGTIVKTKTFKDETERLLIGVDKTALRYWSHAEKESGGILGGSSSIHRSGSQEIAHPSILEVEEMLSRSGQSLIFESVIAEGLQRLLVEKPIFHETVATLHSHDETKVSSSGFSLFGLGGAPSIPQDPLIGAFASLSRAANSKALIAEAIKTAANIYGSADDANKLFNAVTSGISLDTASIIVGTLAKRYVNLGISFGSTTTTTTSHQTQQIPNEISIELIKLLCPTSVHLQGHHEAREFIVETESFTTTDIVNTATIESKTESSGGSFNPVSAVVGSFFPGMSVGVGTTLMGAVSGSVSDVTQTQRQIMHTPTTVVADRFMLRAGNAHLTDTQIKARLVDAIIRGDMVIESLADEFFSEAKGGSFGIGLGFLSLVNGVQAMADAARVTAGMGGGIVDVEEIERKVNAFASIVGEEQFNLVVGGTLLARSAFYGHQRDAGLENIRPRTSVESTNPHEHIEVGKAVHETVQEEHTKNDGSYSIPIGDAVNVAMSTSQFLDWLSQPSEKDAFRKQIADKAKAEGKSPKEVREESEAAGALVDKIEKQIADEDKIARGTEPSAEQKQDAPISKETPLGKSPEVALQQHLDQKMTRGLFESDKPRTFQQQLHEDYIVSKIAELQYSRNQAADARRIGTAMQNFVAECGDAANKFINGLGVVLGCPQSASAMPILAVPVIAEVTGALLTYAANNPAAFQRFAAQLWSLGGFAYDLYQRGNTAILERSKVGESSDTYGVSSGSSGGGTAMPDPDNGDHDQKSWKSKIHGKAQKTGTEGHDWQSAKRTVKQAKNPDVAEVHMDTSLIRVTKGKVHSRMRPDVTTVRKDGRIITDEVKSDSQTIPQLQRKIQKIQDLLPEEMRGPGDGGKVFKIGDK